MPQYDLHIDIDKAEALGLHTGEINDAIATYWGGKYVNDFTDRGRTKKVYVQADAEFRMQASDFDRYFIRNEQGNMVPFPAFLKVSETKGSPLLERYQGVSSVKILGEAAPGRSSGEAMAVMEKLGAELPAGFGYQWTGLSYQEKMAGSQAGLLYGISLVVVFLCLAALYESWSIPFSVLLAVPSGIFGAAAGVFVSGMHNDVYFHIGLLAVMGLSAKNAILIVEFARDLHEKVRNNGEFKKIAQRLFDDVSPSGRDNGICADKPHSPGPIGFSRSAGLPEGWLVATRGKGKAARPYHACQGLDEELAGYLLTHRPPLLSHQRFHIRLRQKPPTGIAAGQ